VLELVCVSLPYPHRMHVIMIELDENLVGYRYSV
jgi:hypothetical protein